MTPKQFSAALARLDLNHMQAARVLGIGRSSLLRYVNGQQDVPTIVERLLTLLQQHGTPEEWQ